MSVPLYNEAAGSFTSLQRGEHESAFSGDQMQGGVKRHLWGQCEEFRAGRRI